MDTASPQVIQEGWEVWIVHTAYLVQELTALTTMADSVKFLEGEMRVRPACGEIGRERGDALKGSLVLGHRNRGPPVPPAVERGEMSAW